MTDLDAILVVDRPESAAVLSDALARHGCRAEIRPRHLTSPTRMSIAADPLVILRIEAPGRGALAWCRDLREALPESRICVLLAGANDLDRVVALETGADAVLTDPVDPRLLVAQLRALGRTLPRCTGRHVAGSLEVFETRREARLDGRVLDLTDTEYDLLLLLIRRKGLGVSRDVIKRELRGLPYDGRDRSIDLGMVRLRRKLGDSSRRPRYIKTVRGVGYMLVSPAN